MMLRCTPFTLMYRLSFWKASALEKANVKRAKPTSRCFSRRFMQLRVKKLVIKLVIIFGCCHGREVLTTHECMAGLIKTVFLLSHHVAH